MKSGFAGGAAATLVAVLIWGSQFPIAKDTFAIVDSFHVTAIRYGIGSLMLVPILLWREGRSAFFLYGRFWPVMLLGLIGMCGSPMLMFLGIALSRPENAVIIVALQPSMTALADWVVHGRRPANFTLGCMAIAFIGVVMVVMRGNPLRPPDDGELIGDFVVILGAVCWIVYTMSAESIKGWSALRFTTLTIIPGTLGNIALTAVLVAAGQLNVPSSAALFSVSWELSYLTVGGIVISMVCWNAGAQRIGALNAMLLVSLMPVVTFGVRFAQGARFQASEIFGAALVIAALIANNIYLRRMSSRINTAKRPIRN